MDNKTKKIIRRYAKLRSLRNKAGAVINARKLAVVYEMGSIEQQKEYMQEMLDYIEAVQNGDVKAGRSYLEKVVSPNIINDRTTEGSISDSPEVGKAKQNTN